MTTAIASARSAAHVRPARVRSRTALSIAAGFALMASAWMPAHAAAAGGGIVYLESNMITGAGNSIMAYRQNKNGKLVELPGSPYATRGLGVVDPSLALGPFDSDQLIITNAEHTLLFAVNPGSNSVAVFNIHDDGSLTHVAGSPFPSGGANPTSLGLSKDTLVVVNKAMNPAQKRSSAPNYASFHVNAEGQLSPIPSSIVSVAPDSSPSQALIAANGRLAFGSDFLGGTLQSFVLQPDGSLTQNLPQLVPDHPFQGSAAPHLALGLAAHPSRPIVYAGLVTINKVAVFEYDASGVLAFQRAVDDSGAGVCWIRVNAQGTRMYTSNTGDNSISVYDLADPLRPVQIQKTVLGGEGSGFQIEISPDGKSLYALSQRASATVALGQGNNLHVLSIDAEGLVFEAVQSPIAVPVPAGIRPQGLATF